MSADLASWLLNQIAEDERMALEAADGIPQWVASEETVYRVAEDLDSPSRCDQHQRGLPNDCDDNPVLVEDDLLQNEPGWAAKHVANFDPARVLAECEAKKKIIERCALLLEAFDDPAHGAWHDVNRRERSHARMTLEALALPFADRPGYQERWRP